MKRLRHRPKVKHRISGNIHLTLISASAEGEVVDEKVLGKRGRGLLKPIDASERRVRRKISHIVDGEDIPETGFSRMIGRAKGQGSIELDYTLQMELYVGAGHEQLIGPCQAATRANPPPEDFIFAKEPLSALLYDSLLQLGFKAEQLIRPISRTCPLCKRKFKKSCSLSNVHRHMMTHFHGVGYFDKCPFDEFQTNSATARKRHLKECVGLDYLDERSLDELIISNRRLV